MATHHHKHQSSTTQHGSALVVSLLILLVLTLIGVTSMSTTTLQSKMATNSREYNLAFQAAESALRYAEAALVSTPPLTGYGTVTGLYPPSTAGQVWSPSFNWSTSSLVYGGLTSPTTTLTGIPATLQPRYIIEKLPPVILSGGSMGNSTGYGGGPIPQYFRVTATGNGPNGSATVVVQSIYH